jgi:flagellar hook-associated protein 1 FlgK
MNVGLYASVQGLLSAQRAVDVASHNIANSETEGYSRQRTEQSASTPMGYSPYGQVGTGVTIDSIRRIRDTLLDRQVRQEMAPLGESEARAEALGQIEDILSEPSDGALSTKLAAYYDGWQKLSTNPENYNLRIALRESAVDLANTFNSLYQDLQGLRQDLSDRIATQIDDVNSKSKQIAELNRQITATLAAGQNPNDLKDQQDLLIDQLSKMVRVQAVEVASTGATNVYVGGDPLVVEGDAFTLTPAPINPLTDQAVVNYGPTGLPANITGGSLRGMLDIRNDVLGVLPPAAAGDPEGMVYHLDQLAAQLIADTNALHTQGFGLDGTTTLNFFNGTNASDIVVNQNITNLSNGLDFIAAAANDPGSLAGGPGDNGMAILIAQRRNALTMGGLAGPPVVPPKDTFENFWKQEVSNLAVLGQSANRLQATQQTLLTSVKERRDQVSAVSTDEEMANVIRYQKAYAASAKLITTIDEMLDTLINIRR